MPPLASVKSLVLVDAREMPTDLTQSKNVKTIVDVSKFVLLLLHQGLPLSVRPFLSIHKRTQIIIVSTPMHHPVLDLLVLSSPFELDVLF